MKKIFSVLSISLFAASTLFAQEEKYGATPEEQQKCKENLSLYREYRDQKMYDEAFDGWKTACEICPKSAKTLYTDGVDFYEYKIEKETDEAKKAELIEKLLAVYDARIEHFGEKYKVLGKKGISMLKYNRDEPMKAYAVLKESADNRKAKSEPGVLSAYYQALFIAVVKGMAEKEQLISDYMVLTQYLDEGMKNTKEKYKPYYQRAKDAMDESFVKVAECPDVEGIAKKQFEANPTGVETLKKLSGLLQKRDCVDGEIYEKVATKLNQLDPSATASYGLGVYMLKKGRYSEALTFLEKAVDLADNDDDKKKYLLAASGAAIAAGKNSAGASLARKVLSIDPNNGDAYLSIGQAIAASRCGDNEFNKKTVYWLAVDYFVKAKSVDASVAEKANKLIGSYSSRFPDKKMMFQYGQIDAAGSPKNEPVQIGCWVNESTKPRL